MRLTIKITEKVEETTKFIILLKRLFIPSTLTTALDKYISKIYFYMTLSI